MEIISRKESKRQGLKRYFTGKACPRGHVALRRTINSECLSCHNHLSYIRKYSQLAVSAGREKPLFCEVCGDKGRINYDHCHKSGKFRAWLCTPCNLVLGYCNDDPVRLEWLITYLEKHNED